MLNFALGTTVELTLEGDLMHSGVVVQHTSGKRVMYEVNGVTKFAKYSDIRKLGLRVREVQ